MKYQRPLINPSQSNFDKPEEPSEEEIPLPEEISKDQLQFNIDRKKESFLQRFNTFKYRLKRRIEYIESSILWKSSALPFAISSVFIISTVIFIGGLINFSKIPPEVPFFYNSINNTWDKPADKSIVFIGSILIIILEILLVGLIVNIFKFDTRLAKVLSWMLLFINTLIFVSIYQFFTLVT